MSSNPLEDNVRGIGNVGVRRSFIEYKKGTPDMVIDLRRVHQCTILLMNRHKSRLRVPYNAFHSARCSYGMFFPQLVHSIDWSAMICTRRGLRTSSVIIPSPRVDIQSWLCNLFWAEPFLTRRTWILTGSHTREPLTIQGNHMDGLVNTSSKIRNIVQL